MFLHIPAENFTWMDNFEWTGILCSFDTYI